jgi:tetratricopeptide (TPR) repeat protein
MIEVKNNGGETSTETYTKGELRTYSKFTLKSFEDHGRQYKQDGVNFAFRVKDKMVQMYRYTFVDDVEAKSKVVDKLERDIFLKELDSKFKTEGIKEAEKYIVDSMERVIRENDLPALLTIANELGGIYRVTNRFEEAKKVYAVVEEVIQRLGLDNTEQHGTTLLNLASVYTEAGDPSKALELYKRVDTIFECSGLHQDYRMAAFYNNISHAYEKLGMQDEAVAYAEKALTIIKSLSGYEVELATTHTTLATRYIKKQRLDEALEHLKEAELIFLNLPGKLNVHYAATLNSLGELFYRREQLEESAQYYEQALVIVKANYGENKAYAEIAGNLAMVNQTMKSKRMAGLELSEAYYNEYGRKMIRDNFPEYEKYMAVGLVGEGSECFGFDDEFSESHDFGPGFCIWLPDEIYQSIGWKVKEAYEKMPKNFQNKRRMETIEGSGRVGVFSMQEFYKKYTGCPEIPKNNIEWLFTPETSLATVTNGKIFEDHLGEFTRIRNGLLGFYPRDIYLKKLAARMAMMSQTGQYNYERCMKRKEYAAAYLASSEFIKTTVSMVYLLNQRYAPFYKWMFRGMGHLERLREVKPMLEQLMLIQDTSEHTYQKVALIEDICVKIRDELIRQGIITGTDAFLNSHCRSVLSLILDPQIKSLPVMFDGK